MAVTKSRDEVMREKKAIMQWNDEGTWNFITGGISVGFGRHDEEEASGRGPCGSPSLYFGERVDALTARLALNLAWALYYRPRGRTAGGDRRRSRRGLVPAVNVYDGCNRDPWGSDSVTPNLEFSQTGHQHPGPDGLSVRAAS